MNTSGFMKVVDRESQSNCTFAFASLPSSTFPEACLCAMGNCAPAQTIHDTPHDEREKAQQHEC